MRFLLIGILLVSLGAGCAKIDDFKVGDTVTLKLERGTETTGTIRAIEGEWITVESSADGQIDRMLLKRDAIKSVKAAPVKQTNSK